MMSYFEVNVSLNGKHFFATAPRSLTDLDSAKRVYRELRDRFPAKEGFVLKCTYWTAHGTDVKID